MPSFLSRVLLLSTYVNLAFSYYCTNPGYPCLNGGTCQYNGECTCTSGFRGFNCGLDSSTIAATCTIECHNKGICYNGNQCYCTKDYMGFTCQQAYDYAECGATSVKLKAYRPIEFTGEIFTMESMFKCKLQHVQEVQPSLAGYKLYELNVPHESTGPCKLHKTIDKMTGEAHFAVNVSTVHRKGQFGMYDGLKTVSCHYGSREQAIVTDVTNHDGMVTMTTTDVDNNPVRERQANENLYLNFEIVQLPAGFTAIEVLDIDMYMIAEQWGDIITIPLMKDGCPTQNSQAFGFAVSPRELTPNGARIPMTAVPVFENIPGEYFFNYRLKLCKNKAVCEKDPTCPSLNPKPLPTGEIFKHKQQGLLIN